MPAYTPIGCSTQRRSLFYGGIHKTPSWNMLALQNSNLGLSFSRSKMEIMGWGRATQSLNLHLF